jgi:hypothetical protein
LQLPYISADKPIRKRQMFLVIHQSQKHWLNFGECRLLEPKASKIEEPLG